jgi:endo-1,4-beta-mannosidase
MDNGEHWIIEAYLDELVPPFAGDPRIAAWDVLNEGDYAPEVWGTPMEKVVAYERAAADHLHSIDPNHLVTAHRAYAGYAHETQDYADYVTFHGYEPLYGLRERIQQLRSRLLRPMPLVIWASTVILPQARPSTPSPCTYSG